MAILPDVLIISRSRMNNGQYLDEVAALGIKAFIFAIVVNFMIIVAAVIMTKRDERKHIQPREKRINSAITNGKI